MPLTADDFRNRLKDELEEAQKAGRDVVEIRSGDLHRYLGDYPGSNHRMPVCCHVMRQEMKGADSILKQPQHGNGANLIIRYHLPR